MGRQQTISASEIRQKGGLEAFLSGDRPQTTGSNLKCATGEIRDRFEGMNKTEAAYARFLDQQIAAGEVFEWRYEAIKLKLARKCFYTPDFFVLLPDGKVEFHETKGFMRDDAAVKIKVAAKLFPWFTFRLIFKKKKHWDIYLIKRC